MKLFPIKDMIIPSQNRKCFENKVKYSINKTNVSRKEIGPEKYH